MLALQHFLGQPIGLRVGVVRELAKLRVDAPACLAAEQVREVHGAPAGRGIALPEPLGPRARRGHGEQLGAHVHQSEQHGLAVLELGPEAHHRVEHPARQAPGGPLHVAQVFRERPEAGVLGPEPPTEPAGRIPPSVEQGRAHHPAQTLGERLRGVVRAALFYGWWYPSRWLGWGFWPKYTGFGPLAKHLRYVERAARRLARGVYHAMMRFGPKLEYRQAVLFRLVDVGAELFAMAAACARAQWLLRHDPAAGRRAVELADLFCRQARARVHVNVRELRHNGDTRECQ